MQARRLRYTMRPLLAGFRRREAAAHDVFGDRARKQEVFEIALAAGLGAAAAHLKAPEGMAFHDRARDAAVEVEIADEKFALGAFECARTPRKQAAGQRV